MSVTDLLLCAMPLSSMNAGAALFIPIRNPVGLQSTMLKVYLCLTSSTELFASILLTLPL